MAERDRDDYLYPDNLRYGPEHEWAVLGDDGLVTMGITDYAQDQLGELVWVQLPTPGQEFERGTSIAEVESAKSASEIVAPCSGVVAAVNERLEEDPEIVNQDPYGEGWFVRIRPSDPAELGALRDAEAYRHTLD